MPEAQRRPVGRMINLYPNSTLKILVFAFATMFVEWLEVKDEKSQLSQLSQEKVECLAEFFIKLVRQMGMMT
jgi:hypothetical protein